MTIHGPTLQHLTHEYQVCKCTLGVAIWVCCHAEVSTSIVLCDILNEKLGSHGAYILLDCIGGQWINKVECPLEGHSLTTCCAGVIKVTHLWELNRVGGDSNTLVTWWRKQKGISERHMTIIRSNTHLLALIPTASEWTINCNSEWLATVSKGYIFSFVIGRYESNTGFFSSAIALFIMLQCVNDKGFKIDFSVCTYNWQFIYIMYKNGYVQYWHYCTVVAC